MTPYLTNFLFFLGHSFAKTRNKSFKKTTLTEKMKNKNGSICQSDFN